MKYIDKNNGNFLNKVNHYTSIEVQCISEKFDCLLSDNSISIDCKINKIEKLIQQSEELLKLNHTNVDKMQIYYDIATAYSDIINVKKSLEKQFIEKSIFNFRMALKYYEDIEPSIDEKSSIDYVAMRCHTNLGNIMRDIGRYICAIDNYHSAIFIDNGFAMATLNLSETLLDYSFYQIKEYEQQYYHHASYYYYQCTIKYQINLEDISYLDKLSKRINIFHNDYVENFLNKPLKLPDFHIDSEEYNYRYFLKTQNLFLEICSDILNDDCFAVDSLILPKDKLIGDRYEFYALFNQIKSEYIYGRYLWYASTENKLSTPKYVEEQNDIFPINTNHIFNVNDTLLRASYRILYSIFDKIGYFLNYYFDVGLKERDISFKNIWKDCKNNKPIKFPNQNVGLKALYWLQKDLYDEDSMNNTMSTYSMHKDKNTATNPFAFTMSKMRNDIEHNFLITARSSLLELNKNAKITKYVISTQIDMNVKRIIKLLREAIIYLSIAVNEDIKDKL